MIRKREGMPVSTPNIAYKGRNYQSQMQAVIDSFHEGVKTMLEVSKETCIYRANICRYVRILKKTGLIFLVSKNRCRITNHLAGFYTTNKSLVNTPVQGTQLELFGREG